MDRTDITPGDGAPMAAPAEVAPMVRLRLYVARSTPNSVRAQHNLQAALSGLSPDFVPPAVEIVDVFAQPKRAIVDGVVVTPTLIGLTASKRMVLMGDLADTTALQRIIEELI